MEASGRGDDLLLQRHAPRADPLRDRLRHARRGTHDDDQLVDCDLDAIRIGQTVRVVFKPTRGRAAGADVRAGLARGALLNIRARAARLERVRASVRERVPRLDRDRYLAPDISAAAGSCAPARLPPPWGSSCLPSMAQRNDLVLAFARD